MRPLGAVLLTIVCLGAGLPASAEEKCNPEAGVRLSGLAGSPWTVQVQLKPQEVPLNAPFDAIVTICTQKAELPSRVTVDATMPAHNHGMNYEPKTTKIDDRRYEVKNLVFHMPGIWRLEITAYADGKPHRFTLDVPLQ